MPEAARIEIDCVEPAFEGRSFGAAGAYEKVVGRFVGAADPDHPLNAGIVGLARAPRNADGLVDYACDFFLLKPVDLRRGNRRILYDVLNRGNKVALHTLNDAPRNPDGGMRIACNDPSLAIDAGNGFLMRQGYALLWSGWQGGGVMPGEGRMAASFPVATAAGAPIVGVSREEFVFEHRLDPAVAPLSYPAADMDPANATLTVRARERDARVTLPAASWRYRSPNEIEIDRPEGYDASAIYEFIYRARDPVVMGLGFAAVRDLVEWLRTAPGEAANPLSLDGAPAVDLAYAYGMSQAGRFLRDFLWQGFNQRLGGGKVFDGVLACMAGSRKAFVNAAFAQPNRFSRQHEDRLFPDDQFPFTYAVATDPVSGRRDGILGRCEATGTCPKLMQVESSSDFFQGRSSLLAVDGEGADVPVPANVRLYHLAGVQHGGGGDPTIDFARMFPSSAYVPNRLDCANVHRALLVALDHWVTDGALPPPSRFPSLRDGTLVAASPEGYGFPAIPGVTYPGLVNALSELDDAVQPPRPIQGHDYLVLVPAIDADGNEVGGIRLPEVAAPCGTHTGWTMRREGHAPGELGSTGSYFPFAATCAERLAAGDPRPSMEERYRDEGEHRRRLLDAARELRARGLMLEEDVRRYAEPADAGVER